MRIDLPIFFSAHRANFGPLKQAAVDGLKELLGFIEADFEWKDPRQVSYLLATIKHECANRWRPIEEFASGWDYDPSVNPKKAAALGNTERGDGPRYKGRGGVQCTGKRNYRVFAELLGVDLVGQPELALDPAISYQIASIGMRRGLFTGRSLDRYINANGCDYRSARRVINGMDRAELIAGYADRYEAVLRAAA